MPGGFGSRAVEGKITAVNWARVHKKPFLGVCLGLQVAVIEFARNVLELQGADRVNSLMRTTSNFVCLY